MQVYIHGDPDAKRTALSGVAGGPLPSAEVGLTEAMCEALPEWVSPFYFAIRYN